MNPDFWHQRWQKGQTGFHQATIHPCFESYWHLLEANQGDTVFVPLCGKTLDMRWLTSQGYRVIGVELSPLAVQAYFAECRLTPILREDLPLPCWEAENVTVFCGDFFHLTPPLLNGVKQVYDRAALIALPRPLRKRYVDHLNFLLPYPVNQLVVTLEYPEGEMQGPPFSVLPAEIEELYGDRYQINQLSCEVPPDYEKFRHKGVSWMQESVCHLCKV